MNTKRMALCLAVTLCFISWLITAAHADDNAPEPIYKTIEEMSGMKFAYVKGSVYDKYVESRIENTTTIDSAYPDVPAILASVDAYCVWQFFSKRATYTCRLLIEEVVTHHALALVRKYGLGEHDVLLHLQAGEGGVDMIFSVDYRGTGLEHVYEPDSSHEETMVRSIIENLIERIETEEPGLIKLYLKQ